MVRFSAKPKKRTTFSPSRERSEREMQKTLLGYAHSSVITCKYMNPTDSWYSRSFQKVTTFY
ncbi:MAG: hypothetical protein U5L45_24975 [Saprospiraceae bacterium]|nr:hypothetical protein [Saprospiraceae bacterium]